MSQSDILIGRRVPDDEWFEWQADGRIEPGDYGCQEISGAVQWFTCNPDGFIGWLAVHEPDKAGNHHVITEHDDGTISVGGSIKTPDGAHQVFRGDQIGGGPISSPDGWHGHLEFGRWRPA